MMVGICFFFFFLQSSVIKVTVALWGQKNGEKIAPWCLSPSKQPKISSNSGINLNCLRSVEKYKKK